MWGLRAPSRCITGPARLKSAKGTTLRRMKLGAQARPEIETRSGTGVISSTCMLDRPTSGNFRSGSNSVIATHHRRVRFTSVIGHLRATSAGPKSANNGSNQTSSRSHTLDNVRGRRHTKRHERHRVSRNTPLIKYRYLFLNLLHRPDWVLGLRQASWKWSRHHPNRWTMHPPT
jgi:hypothetical protein